VRGGKRGNYERKFVILSAAKDLLFAMFIADRSFAALRMTSGVFNEKW
jgi:hypothetical protein